MALAVPSISRKFYPQITLYHEHIRESEVSLEQNATYEPLPSLMGCSFYVFGGPMGPLAFFLAHTDNVLLARSLEASMKLTNLRLIKI